MINQLIWLVPVLPLLSALWIGISYVQGDNRGEQGEKLTATIASSGLLIALIFMLIIDINALFSGIPGQVIIGEWLHSGNYQVLFNFYLDGFALVLTTLIVLICFLGLRFSINYLHREQGFQRFFMILCVFSSAMLLIVSSGNMVLTFVGWEMAGMSSYLLIAYNYERTTSANNATRVVITNRIGDAGFIMGIVSSFWLMGDINWTTLESHNLSTLNSAIIACSFLLAALVKSAQFPFSPWISRALEGPTPSSALFYGSLMVHAGIYLLIRLQPLLEQNHTVMLLIVVLALLTIIYGYFCGLVQSDIKSSLIFSTTTHTGLMLLFIGLDWFALASWYLVLHAAWRAFQFLHAPSLMHLENQPIPSAGQWLSKRPWLYTLSLQRFWLDHFANWAIISPTKTMAYDAHLFEENYISHILGKTQLSMSDKQTRTETAGLVGHFIDRVASFFSWIEESFILKSSGEGLLAIIQKIGKYLVGIEELLNKPRYLMFLVGTIFVIIL